MINTLHSDHYQITTEISRLGSNGGVPYNEQLAIARRWDRAKREFKIEVDKLGAFYVKDVVYKCEIVNAIEALKEK